MSNVAGVECPAGDRDGRHRGDVIAYWNRAHDAYLADVGTTFQAGRIATGTSRVDSNVWLARSAGLRMGDRVLDAGCGVCGPAIDMAQAIERLKIVGLTIVPRQATHAAALIAAANVTGRVCVLQGDYHAPPFTSGSFDAVLFLESIGYAAALRPLFDSMRRVLKPGGTLYIKDVFRREPLWSDQEREELAEFDRVYAQRTRSLDECVKAVVDAGFVDVRARDLSDIVTTAEARRAMFDTAGHETAFGRLHYRRHACVPVYFAELKARARPG